MLIFSDEYSWLQLVPTTVLAILIGIGYKNPTEIIAPTILVTLIAFSSAIIMAKIAQKICPPQLKKNRKGGLL